MVFRRAIATDELWSGEKLGLMVDDTPVLLVHLGDQFHAYEDRCLHKQVTLSDGELIGTLLRCAVHEWEYDLRTGACVNPRNRCLLRFPIEIRDGAVFIDVEASSRSEGR